MAHSISYTLNEGYTIRDEQGVFVARRDSYKVVASDLMALDDLPAIEAFRLASAALRKGLS